MSINETSIIKNFENNIKITNKRKYEEIEDSENSEDSVDIILNEGTENNENIKIVVSKFSNAEISSLNG
jgi:hypothetical protein